MVIIGEHSGFEERISIIDSNGQVDRHIEDFDYFMTENVYEYRGYRRVNGVVYHLFWYTGP